MITNIKAQSCDQSNPIYKDSQCQLTYCTQEQLDQGECIIANDIIKTQWLTNIIKVGLGYLYVSITGNSEGLILLASKYNGDKVPENNDRQFFGIRKDGRGFFKDVDTNDETYIYYVSIDDSNQVGKFESSIHFIQLEKDPKQKYYLLSIEKNSQNFEIYDFENRLMNLLNINEILTGTNIKSINNVYGDFIEYLDDDNNVSYFYSICQGYSPYSLSLIKLSFSRFDINSQNPIKGSINLADSTNAKMT